MPRLRTAQERADLADALATTFALVEYAGTLYMPVHFMTKEPLPAAPEETVWIPLEERKILGMANLLSGILFASDGEVRSFRLMLGQLADQVHSRSDGILVRIKEEKVMLLNKKGELEPVTGDFVPNYLDVPYDEDEQKLADELFATISEWVGGDDQAHSLLYHLATILQPGWSAVRYVLLIGSGRNGKSLLLKMLHALIGEDNISGITRQLMAASSSTMSDLNGKLANIVLDGPKEFIKDSSNEKTLIAGERLIIERKYENAPFKIQTNALFIEGLQQEPKVSDKSPALQKRLVRYRFDKVFSLDLNFEAEMMKPEKLAAMLSLLLKHWVNKGELADKLALTAQSMDLQMESVWAASPLLRFLEHTARRDKEFLQKIIGQKMMIDTFMAAYRPWLDTNGYKNVEDDYLLQMINDSFVQDRKTFRVEGKATSRRYIKSVQPDTLNVINRLLDGDTLEGAADDAAVLEEVEGL